MDLKRLDSVNQIRVLVFGDFMIDQYIDGDVLRISPEAPVPVLKVKETVRKLGGAGNVVSNLIALGAKVRVAGCIGNDAEGSIMMDTLTALGVNTQFLYKEETVQTIVKTRIISKNQQYLRLDKEIVADMPKTIEDNMIAGLEKILQDIDVVIISDYGKGMVTRFIAEEIIAICNRKDIVCVVDPKGSQYEKYSNATLCKPNINELETVCGCKFTKDDEIERAAIQLKRKFNMRYLALSRSEKGIMLIDEEDNVSCFPTQAKEIVDVTGAGDTVIALLALSLAVGYTAEEGCILANVAASCVCSKFGAATVSLNEITDITRKNGKGIYEESESVKKSLENLKAKGKKVVFTNGCYDLLHAGHLSSFYQAKALGDLLVVAVNSDISVKKLKGDLRPIIDEKNRMQMISSLDCVDYVILMKEDNPVNLIKKFKPDIVVKGKDWEDKYMPEREIIEEYGGQLCFIQMETGFSTTNIIEKILECYANE